MDSQEPQIFREPYVFLTISSQVDQKGPYASLDRRIIMHWNNFDKVQMGDFIAVYDRDPTTFSVSELTVCALDSYEVKEESGHHLTAVQLPREFLKGNSEDMGRWIAYITHKKGSEIRCTNVLKSRPNWMHNLREKIGNLPLLTLMIPGSHDSGSYKEYSVDECENVITRYAICQEESIYNQLMFGVRYFDFRIAKDSEIGLFFINHSWYESMPLHEAIDDIQRFLENRSEIIFLDIHALVNGFFCLEDHKRLIRYMTARLGKMFLRKSADAPISTITLNSMLKDGKKIIFSYANTSIAEGYEYVYPSVVHEWGNVSTSDDLREFVTRILSNCDKRDYFWALMAEVTPNFWNWIWNHEKGIRGFSQEVNPHINNWISSKSLCLNLGIVATDFFLGSNVIELAIRVNELKSQNEKPVDK